MAKLSIVLMTFNRPLEALNAINSILSQSTKNFELVVSDNSENNILAGMIHLDVGNDLLDFRYIKRSIVLSPNEHFTLCISEVKTEYVCLFHDDDLMHTNFVDDALAAIENFPRAIAFGGNAVWDFKGESKKTSFQSLFTYLGPISSKKLLPRYFSRHQLGIAPFPSYIYKADVVKKFVFSPDDGKYGDVKWLSSLCDYGEVYWINKIMMTYKIHASSGGIVESRRDRLKFMGYIKKNINNLNRGILADYRHFIYKKNISAINNDIHPKMKGVMSVYLNKYKIRRWLRFDHLLQLLVKIVTRIFIRFQNIRVNE